MGAFDPRNYARIHVVRPPVTDRVVEPDHARACVPWRTRALDRLLAERTGGLLTARQRDVAALIARGLTNDG